MKRLANVLFRVFVLWGLLSWDPLYAVRIIRKNEHKRKSTAVTEAIPATSYIRLLKPIPPTLKDDEFVQVVTTSPEELEDEDIDIESIDQGKRWPPVATVPCTENLAVKVIRRKSRDPVFLQDCNLDLDYDLEGIIQAWETNKKCIIAMADESSICLKAIRIGLFLEKFGVARSQALLYDIKFPIIYQWITSVEYIPKRHVRLFKRKLSNAFWSTLMSIDAEIRQELS